MEYVAKPGNDTYEEAVRQYEHYLFDAMVYSCTTVGCLVALTFLTFDEMWAATWAAMYVTMVAAVWLSGSARRKMRRAELAIKLVIEKSKEDDIVRVDKMTRKRWRKLPKSEQTAAALYELQTNNS